MREYLAKSSLFILLTIIASAPAIAEVKKSSDEIIVGFVKDTSENDITAFQKKYNLVVIKPFKRICAVRYKVDKDENSGTAIKSIKQEKIVRYVEVKSKPKKK